MIEEIQTWYELKKFVNTLKGDHLGQPVKVTINGKEVDINSILIDNGKIILDGTRNNTNRSLD